MNTTISLHTFGCRLNTYESDGILQSFIESNHYISVSSEAKADIAIINTCTVTKQADNRNKALIRKILRQNPHCYIVVTGCYAQTDSQALRESGAGLIVGNTNKSQLLAIVTKNYKKNKGDRELNPISEKPTQNAGTSLRPLVENPFGYGMVMPQNHTRAYIKIQDGCDKKCSYCKIPFARGQGVSRPIEDILEHVKYLQDREVPEIILTGVNLGWYRDRKAQIRFITLLEKILQQLNNTRLRLSSIEPCDVDAALAALTCHPNFCDFLHVPLQSGSHTILRAMRRSYTPYSFQKRLEVVLQHNPDIFIGTDLMVGFPGENDADFKASLQLCRDLNIASIHGFRFSARYGTDAMDMQNQIAPTIIRQRMQYLQNYRQNLWKNYVKNQSNKRSHIQAIVEKVGQTQDSSLYAEALSGNYLRFIFSIPKGTFLKKGQYVTLSMQDYPENMLIEEYKLKANIISST